MVNTNEKPFYHQFEEKHHSESTETGTAACRTDIIIHHKDTLERSLPKGIMVKVYDQDGGVSYGEIDENGDSHHIGVKCGLISWQLMRGPDTAPKYDRHKKDGRQLTDKDEHAFFNDSDGYVLIKANDEKTEDPRLQLAKPLKVFVSVNAKEVKAIYLPPPILLNLRFRQNSETRLSTKQLEQIKKDGNTATLFIHGYNVSLGHIGKFPQSEDFGELPEYSNLPPSDQIQRPYLHYDNKAIGQLAKNTLLEQAKEDDNIYVKHVYNEVDLKVNGHKALGWFPHVEYYLNLAASGKLNYDDPFTDWDKYHRIIGVTWSGSVDPSMVFFRAEMYANEAGRELAKVLIELFNEGIKVNIITHSLGARVALAALNILGDANQPKKIKNLIMLEAAVADNAITANYTREKNPVAMELFPFAYKAAEYIRIMYSKEDGVLGPDNSLLDLDDGVSDVSRGAYPLKYGVIAGKTNAFGDYYPHGSAVNNQRANAQSESVQAQCKSYIKNKDQRFKEVCDYILKNQPSISKAQIENELKALIQNEMKMVNDDWQTELKILRPWSHFRRFPENEDYVKHITDILMTMVFRNTWKLSSKELEIRPALGHVGDKFTAPVQKNPKLLKEYPPDNFISGLKEKQFFYHDQSSYFTSHSAIKDLIWEEMTLTDHQRKRSNPTRFSRIYRETYKDQIMDKYIKKFGRY